MTWVGLGNLDIQQIWFLEAGAEDSSFKKAQETLHYVAKDTARVFSALTFMINKFQIRYISNHPDWVQEIEWQGLGQLRGITSSLMASGAFGKHPQNVRRDMLRKLAAKNPDSPVPWHQSDIQSNFSTMQPPFTRFTALTAGLSIYNWLMYKVPIDRVQVPLWELDGDGNYFVEERTFNKWPMNISTWLYHDDSFAYITIWYASGQDNASCATSSAFSMDDATWDMAKVGKRGFGWVLEPFEDR